MTGRRRITRAHRRGSVVAIILWTIAVAALLTAAVQMVAYRQATLGREALARVQARWAARAGVEQMIAIMEYHTEFPDAANRMQMVWDMEDFSYGEVIGATYEIRHFADGQVWAGPLDEHSRINVNTASRNMLLNLPDMPFDVADAIIDWIDTDDNVSDQGAEEEYYVNLAFPYRPRNGPVRSIAELELVAGVWTTLLRGEDWNLNNRLDANEDDGQLSEPEDDDDGELDGGWASYLTAYSRESTIGAQSGQPRIHLPDATADDLMFRLDITEAQAEALISFGGGGGKLDDLVSTPLSELGGATGGGAGSLSGAGASGGSGQTADDDPSAGLGDLLGGGGSVDLDAFQLQAVLDETTTTEPDMVVPGKININTVSERLMRDVLALDTTLVDEIISFRNASPEGIGSMNDLLESDIEPDDVTMLSGIFTTTSNVYSITSRGRSLASGLEVEMYVVVDRSTLPLRILEYREQ